VPESSNGAVSIMLSSTGDRQFESFSLQRGVRCEPVFRGRIPSMVVEGLDSSGRRWRSRVAIPIIWLFVQPLRPVGLFPRGTDGSNPVPSTGESGANLIFGDEPHRGPLISRRRVGAPVGICRDPPNTRAPGRQKRHRTRRFRTAALQYPPRGSRPKRTRHSELALRQSDRG
jgi:hypothetical protein